MGRKATDYFRANQGFATVLDGEPIFVQKGELVHKDHDLLKGRKDLFEPAENFGRFDVEAATAAPGETRDEKPAKVEQATAAPGEKRGG